MGEKTPSLVVAIVRSFPFARSFPLSILTTRSFVLFRCSLLFSFHDLLLLLFLLLMLGIPSLPFFFPLCVKGDIGKARGEKGKREKEEEKEREKS